MSNKKCPSRSRRNLFKESCRQSDVRICILYFVRVTAVLDQNAEYMCTFLFSSVVERVFFCAAVRSGHALKVCDRVALLAVSADEVLHISARLVLGSARGAGFDDRLLFHGGVTENILRHFELIAYWFHMVIPERRRHTASTRSKGGHPMFGRSVRQLRAGQMTHTTC